MKITLRRAVLSAGAWGFNEEFIFESATPPQIGQGFRLPCESWEGPIEEVSQVISTGEYDCRLKQVKTDYPEEQVRAEHRASGWRLTSSLGGGWETDEPEKVVTPQSDEDVLALNRNMIATYVESGDGDTIIIKSKYPDLIDYSFTLRLSQSEAERLGKFAAERQARYS